MQLKTKTALVAAGVDFIAAFAIWPGCGAIPLPASRTPLSSFKPADFSFGKNEHATRDEVAAKIGQPNEYFADLRVACYKLNRVNRRRLVVLFLIPVGAPKDGDSLEVAMIQYDDQDREQRVEIRTLAGDYLKPGTLRWAAQQWIAKPAKHQ